VVFCRSPKIFQRPIFRFSRILKEGSQVMHEPGQEIISPLAVSDYRCHFEVVTDRPDVAVDTSRIESASESPLLSFLYDLVNFRG